MQYQVKPNQPPASTDPKTLPTSSTPPQKPKFTPPARPASVKVAPATIRYRDVLDATTGKLLVRLEYYHELDPENRSTPKIWPAFKKRMDAMRGEMDKWATVVFDSVTMMELVNRKYYEFVVNPHAESTWDWRRTCTDDLEQYLMVRLAGFPMNVIVISHIDPEKDKSEDANILRYNPRAPGRLRRDLSAAFSEFYHLAVVGEPPKRLLYTDITEKFNASTRIGAPNKGVPTYSGIWSDKRWREVPIDARPAVHLLLYGESGGGKSTCAATFAVAGPLLVFCWDPFGKDAVYMDPKNLGVDAVTVTGFSELNYND